MATESNDWENLWMEINSVSSTSCSINDPRYQLVFIMHCLLLISLLICGKELEIVRLDGCYDRIYT